MPKEKKPTVAVTFRIPVELLEKVRERAIQESWSNTTLFIEALKEFTKEPKP